MKYYYFLFMKTMVLFLGIKINNKIKVSRLKQKTILITCETLTGAGSLHKLVNPITFQNYPKG